MSLLFVSLHSRRAGTKMCVCMHTCVYMLWTVIHVCICCGRSYTHRQDMCVYTYVREPTVRKPTVREPTF